MQYGEGIMDFVGNMQGAEYLNLQEVIDLITKGEVKKEKLGNMLIGTLPLIGLFDHHGAVAHGGFHDYYDDFITSILLPGIDAQTAQLAGLNLSDPAVLESLGKNYQTNHTIYHILKHVADSEGLTGENEPAELRQAATAIANYESAIAQPLNDALKARRMVFYEGELEQALTNTPYVEIAITRFDSDVASMQTWLADKEHASGIVLNAENFASMMLTFSLWSHDDVGKLVDAINAGRITFRHVEGSWDPKEEIMTTLQQFNITNAFGTTSTAVQGSADYDTIRDWSAANPLVIRGGAAPTVQEKVGQGETERAVISAEMQEAPAETAQAVELSRSSAPGEKIVTLKSALNAFMGYEGPTYLDESDNRFDIRTEQAVIALQQLLRIDATGKYDKATEDALNAYITANPFNVPNLYNGVHLLE
jgi:hypothetical protein